MIHIHLAQRTVLPKLLYQALYRGQKNLRVMFIQCGLHLGTELFYGFCIVADRLTDLLLQQERIGCFIQFVANS